MMMDILTINMLRHGPVHNPQKIWYGRDVEFDLTSLHIVDHFNNLAKTLPTDPETTAWLSSDYPRSQTLARFLLKASGVPIPPELVIDLDFREQQYGVMTGMIGDEAKQDPRLTAYFTDMWQSPPQGGESLKMLQDRVGQGLDKLTQNLSPHIKNAVIVAHGGTNMAAFAHVTGQKMIDIFKSKKMAATPSFSYMSRLQLQYDRVNQKWLDAVEYTTGIPKLE